MHARLQQIVTRITAPVLVLAALVPAGVEAAEIEDRSLTLSSSAPGDESNYSFNFTLPSDTVVEGFEAEVCEQPVDDCDTPSGFDSGDAELVGEPSGFGDGGGWQVDTSDDGLLRMNNPDNTEQPDSSQTVTFGNITNPEAANETFFVRMTTYENDDYTGAIDDGVVAVSTAEAIGVEGVVPPILTFCVGVEISGDCSTATGDSIDMGTFSPNATTSATSQMRASTNASDGYVITVEGTTLASGSNTIDELTSPAPAETEQSQFGVNLRDNNDPDVGEDVSGEGDGEVAGDYDIVDEFTFNPGDTVASAQGPTNSNTYTASYIVNIEPQQAAGNYTTTLTYIATATF